MDSQAVAMETQAATNQISISNTMTLDASQIDGNSIIAIDNDGNRIPIIIAPSDSKENGEIKMNDGESVPVVYVENSEEKQGDEEMTENEFEAIVVEQSGDQDLANIQFNVYKTDNNSLVIQIPNDSIAETQIEEQVIEESVQTTIDDIKVAAMSTTCECDICGEYFTNLKDHLTRHPDIETLYSCDTCGKLFSSSDRLTIHLNIHAGNIEDEVITVEKEVESASSNKVGDFVCDVCHKTFTLSKYLQAHKLVHSENKPFQCSMCDKRFSQKRYLKAHELLHKGIKPFNCSKCPKTFTNVTALKAHLNSHIGLKPYKCTMCPKAFYRQSNLSAHVKRHSDPPIKVDYDNKIRCECNLSFINEEELQAHVGMHTGPELFKCTYCTAEFRLLCKLQDHAKMHMGSEKAYECQICGRAYRHKNSLRSHLASHAQEKLWKCNICDKRFSLQGNLRTHEKLHTGLKPFKCELCNKSFARIDHMRQHRKVHDGIRPYKCDICNKAFSRSHHYQAHINNIHNETKPHECNICHKRFGYASNLRTHEKIHYLNKDHQKVFNKCRACGQMITFIQTETTVLQKKEFKCEDCGELFHCAQSLTIHQNSHRGDIPFRCNYCEKQFTNNKNLNKHLKIHSGARAYVCHVCDKTFIFGHHLKRHLMTHTGNHVVVKKEEVTIEEDEEDMENGLNDDNNMMKDDGEVTDLQTEEELNKSEVIEDESVRTDDDTSTEKSNKTANNEGSLETTGKSDKISKTKFTDVICLKRKTDTPDDNGDASAQDKNDSDLKAKDSKGQGQNDSKSSKKGWKVQNEDSDVNAEKSSKLDQEDDKTTRNRKSMKKNESGKKVKDTHKPGVRVSLPRKDDLKCDTCGKTFDNVSNVKRHKYAVHVKGDSSAKSSKKDAKKQSQSEETAKKKLFTENETENENDEEEETFSGEPPENDGPHNCHICKKNFSCLGYLMQHLAKHAGDKPFQCDVCGKGFAMSTYLRKHRASHTSSKGTQATPPSSPVKSEITDTEKDPKVSTLSTMQTRKRKLAVTPDNKNNDVTGKNKSKEQKTQNLEKNDDIATPNKKAKTQEKNDDIATPNKKAKTQEKDDDIATPNTRSKNQEKDDNIATPNKKSKSQEKKDDDMATTNTRSKDQEKEDDDMATTNTRSKTHEKKDDDMATTNTRSKSQEKKDDDIARSKNQEKDKDIVTPKTRSKNQKLVKKEDTESVKQDDDIKSPKVDDVKSPKERSTRSRTVKIEGESKGVVCRSSGDDPLKCDVCGKQFHLPYNYMIHQKMHQVEEEKEFKCDECGSRFKRASGLKKHQETHKKTKTSKTETHNKVKADSKKVKITPQKPVSDSPQTDVSGSPQTDVSGSPQKDVSGSPQKTVTGRPQRAAASRTQRVVTSSPAKGTPIQSIKIETISLNEKLQLDQICKCNTCGKQFADSASLSYHETQHVTNMLKCAYCPKSFFTKYNLDRHESHHNKGPKVDIRSVSVIAVQTNTSEIRKNRKLHESGNSEKKFPVAYHSKRRLGTNIKDKVSVKKQAINKKLKDKLNTSKAKGKVRVQGRTCSVCGVKIYGTFSYRRHLLIHSKYKKMLTDGNINNSSVQSNRPKPSNESVKNRITTSKTKKKPEISSPKNKQVFQSPKSELKSYECHICKKQLSRQYNLKRHLEQHHKLTIIPENASSKSDEVSKVNAEIKDVSEPDVQVDSNETVDDAENTIMVVKHGDDDKDKAVTFFGDFTSQGVNIPEGSIITVMEEETGEELFKVEVNELCSETSESKNVAITKTTNSAEKSQTSLLCTEVLEVDEKSSQNSKSKLNNESNPETLSVATNSNENPAGDIVKSAAPQNEEARKLINTDIDIDK